MTRYAAFLRAINIGGRRVVKMDMLRREFEALGFDNVSTFIASGNVIFDARGKPDAIERRIEGRLQQTLGYHVATFLRTIPELQNTVTHCDAFAAEIASGATLYVAFARSAPPADARRRLIALSNDIDQLDVCEREIFWLCRKYRGESLLTGGAMEKAFSVEATLRNSTTVRKIAAKYCGR